MEKWVRANVCPNRPLRPEGYVTASKEHIALSKEAAKESMVLLKNENKLLPLAKGSRVALFGKGTFDYVKGGGGSGDVTTAYTRNLYEGLSLQQEHVTLYEPLCDFYREEVGRQYKEGAVAGMTVEPALTAEQVQAARAFADIAVVSISRFSGEGWDRSDVEYCDEVNPWEASVTMPQISGRVYPDGDFYLTKEERTMLAAVRDAFEKIVIVLNVGGVIETAWFREDPSYAAVLLAWQDGMEGGLAAAELLCGKGNPSGKLPDTFAMRLEDYPSTEGFHESPHYVDYTEDIYVGYRYFETIPGAAEKVSYPFGYGLSYTRFSVTPEEMELAIDGEHPALLYRRADGACAEGASFDGGGKEISASEGEDESGDARQIARATLFVTARVTNLGAVAGKEVVQLYCEAPQGKLGKPARVLGAFCKTRELLPGESQWVELSLPIADLASYDDLGKVQASAYVLEAGEYTFYLGSSSANVVKLPDTMNLDEDVILWQLSPKLAPVSLQERLCADGTREPLPQGEPRDPNACAFEKMVPGTDEAIAPRIPGRESYLAWEAVPPGNHTLLEVAEGKLSLESFMEQLSDEELIHLLGGQPNKGVANTFGIGNLAEYGIPNVMTADGPAGVRIDPYCGICTTAFPCATALAATWNEELVERVGAAGGAELKENNLSIWLTPAVNLHRNPLCGRNFEYYSEDPLLTGRLAGAMVRGIQSNRVSACVKHFACNNKETNRKHSDSRVSERALREIYLKAFERIVKEADPWCIMSSYNIINGWRASEAGELLTDILRGEWGYQGLVVSDWWSRGEHYKEILAGNDVKMGCGFPERVKKALDMGELTRKELLRSAGRVLALLQKLD